MIFSPRRRPWSFRILAGLLLIAAAIAAWPAFWHVHAKRFRELEPGVFYRVGQPTEFGLRYLIRNRGVKTVLSFQSWDVRLRHGLFDVGDPSGEKEAEFVRSLGARHLQWPLGDEPYWPWPTPWVYDEFFKLIDDPDNLPVVVHCAGGRHRTGSLSALYRLEYDRWPVERVLEEMYSFKFGHPIPIQEHNLRTYTPRPRPAEDQWAELRRAFEPVLQGTQLERYEDLLVALRRRISEPDVLAAAQSYLADGRPFAIPLAQRLVDDLDHPLAEQAASHAGRVIRQNDASPADWSMAAALVADFGMPEDQEALLALLADEPLDGPPTPRYQALVVGVTNRYTLNRLPYLEPLLGDLRQRPEEAARQYRYADTATARLSVILNRNMIEPGQVPPGESLWERGRRLANTWFRENRERVAFNRLLPPQGNNQMHRDGQFEGEEAFERHLHRNF